MIARRIVIVAIILSTTLAGAAPRKILVLPLDGNADPALRAKLSTSIQRLARVADGDVTPGRTTLNDTAMAVGCDPTTAACIDSVRKTLGVDELVYGNADVERGQVTIVVHRTGVKPGQSKHISTTIAATDPADRADPAILPLFTGASTSSTADPDPALPPHGDAISTTTTPESSVGTTTDPSAMPPLDPVPAAPEGSRKQRNMGIAMAVGGGAMVLIGLALWSSKASIQNEIDNHPTMTRRDFDELAELESTASTRAWAGNLVFLGGLALGGYGGYLLWQDHKSRASATLAPRPVETGTGAMLTLRGRW